MRGRGLCRYIEVIRAFLYRLPNKKKKKIEKPFQQIVCARNNPVLVRSREPFLFGTRNDETAKRKPKYFFIRYSLFAH